MSRLPDGNLRHLLVATDGTDNGRRAVSFALALALQHGSELLFCSAVDRAAAIAECTNANGSTQLLFPLLEALDDTAKSILADAARRAADAGLIATTIVLDGRSAEAIVDCAKERGVDAIVMGTQGKHGLERFFLGSTADGVLRRADVPVFVVPPGIGTARSTFDCMVVAVDDSEPSDAAVAFALLLAQAEQARLVFCSVAETGEVVDKAAFYGGDAQPMIAELNASAAALLLEPIDRARNDNVAFESVVADGDPAEQILLTAESWHAGCIAVGTHGRRGLRRLFVGSVAESIVRRSTVPVVVVRVAADRRNDTSGKAPVTNAQGSARHALR